MNYEQYKAMTEAVPIDRTLYRAMLEDAATADSDRLDAILNVFTALNVPENYDGDVQEIWNQGFEEIEENSYSEELREVIEYASMIWAMPPDVSNSVFNTLDQMVDC